MPQPAAPCRFITEEEVCMPGEGRTHNAGVVGSSPTPAISEVVVDGEVAAFGGAREETRGSQNGSQLFAVGRFGRGVERALWCRAGVR